MTPKGRKTNEQFACPIKAQTTVKIRTRLQNHPLTLKISINKTWLQIVREVRWSPTHSNSRLPRGNEYQSIVEKLEEIQNPQSTLTH